MRMRTTNSQLWLAHVSPSLRACAVRTDVYAVREVTPTFTATMQYTVQCYLPFRFSLRRTTYEPVKYSLFDDTLLHNRMIQDS